MAGSRIYVVAEPSLAAAVQRNAKTLSFTPLVPDITRRVLGLDEETVEIVRRNLDPGPGDARGFLADIHEMVYGLLGPGPYLNSLSCQATQELCLQLNGAATSLQGDDLPVVDLLAWIRHLVIVGTANYLLGPRNPIVQQPELEDAFWAFDHGIGGLLVGVLPSVVAPGAYRARETLVAAFLGYLDAGHAQYATQILRDRVRIEEEYGFGSEMIARSCLSFFFATVVNTTTTTFWVVLRLFADGALLNTVRREIGDAMGTNQKQTAPGCLSIGVLKNECATLLAVFRESLRIGSENFSVRLIKEDTLLADRYLLKKGSVVQIAGGVIHADRSIWGDDVDEFNPQRFLTQKAGSVHPAAFRGFGGGKTMCPGRHFATNEILSLAALIVHAFDVSSPDGGPIRVPPKNDRVVPVHVLEPTSRGSPKVVIKPREEAKVLRGLKVVV